ncbi:MAG: hypothetical protein GY798_08965 [Hyphomicrobiales bacterium]|nr:hypothetical protein [Hyphomicrobiales bacterium]
MAQAISGGFDPSRELLVAIVAASALGCVYAFFTVWPKSARFMPSLFGIGIGLLLGTEACLAILAGGLLRSVVTLVYARGRSGEDREAARCNATNDTMLAGASIFAAGAVVSIVLILVTPALNGLGLTWWFLAN